MGSKTLKKGKRTGLTKNQKRKATYSALAAAHQKKSGGGSHKTVSFRPTAARLKKTNHKRGHAQIAADKRKAEAKLRQLSYAMLTTAEKIEKLDKKLGKGVGAVKARKKLSKPFTPFGRDAPVNSLTKEDVKLLQGNQTSIGLPTSPYPRVGKQQKKEAHDKKVRDERDGR